MKKLILIGASGFLGQAAARHFLGRGYDVHIMSRRNPALANIPFTPWDAQSLGDWAHELNDATAVINFTGRSVNCRYQPKNRDEILESRVRSTALIGEAISQCERPPRIWLNASTATIYRHAEDRPMDEDDGEIGTGFSVHVAQSWEQALFSARTPKTVKTALRTSMVLGWGANSVYPVLRRLVKCGLGGPQGNGRQRISWISESDFCRALEHLIQQPLEGPVNLAAPEVLTNRDWLKTMRATARQPIGLPAFRWMLEIGAFFLRTETELVLKSRWIEPKRLVESGFTFLHPKLIDAITALESNKGA